MRPMLLSLVLTGCGSVLLGEEADTLGDGGAKGANDDAPQLTVSVRTASCDCFELIAEASEGQPPYRFEWNDGDLHAKKRVCPGQDAGTGPLELSVFVQDARSARSQPYTTKLSPFDAGCVPPTPPICLKNLSFEGTAAANLGQMDGFDLPSWSACGNGINTPDVGSDTVPQMIAVAPKSSDGATYLGLSEDEQATQSLCEPLRGGDVRSFQIDLARVNITAGTAPDTEKVSLEIYGGSAIDCSRRELLWSSPPLELGWRTYCVTIEPRQYIDSITLRALSDKSQLTLAYLIADHMVPVETCP